MNTRAQQLLEELQDMLGDDLSYDEKRADERRRIAEAIPDGWKAPSAISPDITNGRMQISVTGDKLTVFFVHENGHIAARVDLPLAAVECAIARGWRPE